MQAVILAGGLGTRLGARTRDLPKALLPIAGRPFLAWLVEALVRSGYRQLVLCIGHHGEQIMDYLGTGADFGLDVTYSKDGERLLGTGGAIRQALGRDLRRQLLAVRLRRATARLASAPGSPRHDERVRKSRRLGCQQLRDRARPR